MKSPKKLRQPGQELKALRIGKSLTLSQLAAKTGIPSSTLSKLENGKMMLTYEKLVRLSTGLEEDLGGLLSPANVLKQTSDMARGRRSVSRAGCDPAVLFKVQRHIYPAAELSNKAMVPSLIEVAAKSVKELGGLLSHDGEEYVYVLEGTMDLHSEFYEPLRLERGDSVYFDSGMAHAYIRAGEDRCQLLVVCTGRDAAKLSAAAKASAETERGVGGG